MEKLHIVNTSTKKLALVTGASGGIGKTIALKLIKDGFKVALVARKENELQKVAEEIRSLKGEAVAVACDITSKDKFRTMVSTLEEEEGKIDLLVNCAGRGGGGVTANMDDDLWNDIINTNLNGVFHVTKSILNEGQMSEPGTIINIASTGGKQGVVYGAAYSASKHGVVGFTKALALELATKGITVNAVCPGFVETDMAQRVRESYANIWGVSPSEAKIRIENRIPIGRYIQPEEVADMVSFLASPRARGITGQAINVCGGLGNY